jgi:hypothetical protein
MPVTNPHPTWRDLLDTIPVAPSLPDNKRRHWPCSLNSILRALERHPEELFAEWSCVRHLVEGIHPVPLGWTAKTAANHKSNVKAALAWFRQGTPVCGRGLQLIPAWANLWARVPGCRTSPACRVSCAFVRPEVSSRSRSGKLR